MQVFRLAICVSLPKSKVTADLFGRLSLVLTRSIARAILTRSLPQSFEYTMSETLVRLRYFVVFYVIIILL